MKLIRPPTLSFAVANRVSDLSSHVQLAEEQPTASSSTSAAPPPPQDDVEEDPEDDFNAAWEVLDAARSLYSKMEGKEARLNEAECFLTLGDVSLEVGASPSSSASPHSNL